MPIAKSHMDQAEKLYARAVANTKLSMNHTESKVFDSMNTSINLYFTSLVHLIKGLESQIDDLQSEVRKLQGPSSVVTGPAFQTRR